MANYSYQVHWAHRGRQDGRPSPAEVDHAQGTADAVGSGRDDGSFGDRVASAHLHDRTSGAIVVAEHADDLIGDRCMSWNEGVSPRNRPRREEWHQSLVTMCHPGEVVEHALVDAKWQARQRRAGYSTHGLHQ